MELYEFKLNDIVNLYKTEYHITECLIDVVQIKPVGMDMICYIDSTVDISSYHIVGNLKVINNDVEHRVYFYDAQHQKLWKEYFYIPDTHIKHNPIGPSSILYAKKTQRIMKYTFHFRGNDITLKVREWIRANKMPPPSKWTDDHKFIYRLTWGT